MTEQRAKYLRRTQDLPSGPGLDLLVVWATQGPWNLVPPPLDGIQSRYNTRTRAMQALRRLAKGLELAPAEYEELQRMQGRDFGRLSDTLLDALARRARERGHLMPGGLARTPLTPIQADTLYRVTRGQTCKQIAEDTGTTPNGALSHLTRMREQHQCATTGHLVATAYRHRWLPDTEELRTLLRGRMVWEFASPHQEPGKPPYTWTDNA